jgi:hypothetical protein
MWASIPVTTVASFRMGALGFPHPRRKESASREQGRRPFVPWLSPLSPSAAATRCGRARCHDPARHRYDRLRETAIWANRNPDKPLAMYAKQATLDLTAPHPIVRAPCAETFDPREPQPLIDSAARYGAIKATFPAAEMIWR